MLHVGRPRSLMDYGQESGRAGRDGQVSKALVVLGRGPGPAYQGHAEMDGFLRAECRRQVLEGYLDGRRTESCRGGQEELCDGCRKRQGGRSGRPAAGEKRSRAEGTVWDEQELKRRRMGQRASLQRQQQGLAVEELVRSLERWKSACLVCVLQGRAGDHLLKQCRRAEG